MSRILVVTNECYRSKSASGYCVENILNNMMNEKDLEICLFAFDSQKKNENRGRSEFHYVSNVFFKERSFFDRAIKRCANVMLCPDTSILFVNRMYREIKKKLSSCNFDIILSFSGGYASQLVSLKIYKEFGIKWISCFFDPPAKYNYLFQQQKPYYHRMIEKDRQVMMSSSAILLDSAIYNSMRNEPYISKMFEVGLPLITRRNTTPRRKGIKIKVAFIGTLYFDQRNPQKAIELLLNAKEVSIDFYGNSCTKHVLSELRLCNNRVRYCGEIKHDDIAKHVYSYDYLLNIGNITAVQIPSKLIEYISYGIPIINIVKKKEDPTIELIDSLKDSISILENDCNAVQTILSFLHGPQLSRDNDYVYKKLRLYFPETTANLIKTFLPKRIDQE